MNKPLIGISGNWMSDSSGFLAQYPRSYVNHDYIRSVIEAGGMPIIIPFNEEEDIIKELVSRIDGLILTGGHDLYPPFYGEEPLQGLGEVWPERDVFDFALFRFARERQIPILGICRGHQVINVAMGGTLYQDLKYDENCTIKHFQGHSPSMATHSVDIEEGSKYGEIINKNEMMVNSFHHQTVKKVGEGLKVTSHAKDGTIESLEGTDYPYLVSYQFHPEMMSGKHEDAKKLFLDFIKEASKGA